MITTAPEWLMMKITLLTDAWEPQVNGVVRTWQQVIQHIQAQGHHVTVIHPGLFRTVRMPRYPEIQLALLPARKVRRLIDEQRPDAIHIATEGPIGQAGRRLCLKRGWPFTTSYHTQFPFYLKQYAGIPVSLSYRFIRWFHRPAKAVLVPTQGVSDELAAEGLANTVTWSRGVDTKLFKPWGKTGVYDDLARPIYLYAGRVAMEKNIEAFLAADLPGSKVVVGDGPMRPMLMRLYPDVRWVGYQFGQALARYYAAADVFVFPSRTDTFGVVMLEANACGLPVAAYPVTGPIDVVRHGKTGCLNEDLKQACLEAQHIDPMACRQYAQNNSWQRCAEILLSQLAIIPIRNVMSSAGFHQAVELRH